MRQVEVFEVSRSVRALAGDWVRLVTMPEVRFRLPEAVQGFGDDQAILYDRPVTRIVDRDREVFVAIGPELYELLKVGMSDQMAREARALQGKVRDLEAKVTSARADAEHHQMAHSFARAGVRQLQDTIDHLRRAPWYVRVWRAIRPIPASRIQ